MSNIPWYRRKWIWLVLGILFWVGVYFSPLSHWFTPDGWRSARDWIGSWGIWAPVAVILLYVAATLLLLPCSLLTLTAGGLFGPVWGVIYVCVGANIGAQLGFFAGRYLARGWVEARLKGRWLVFDESVRRHGFTYVFWLRLFPVIPFGIFNYAAGPTSVPWSDYALGTLIGMMPMTIAIASIGSALTKISLWDPQTWINPQVWGPFAVALVIGVSIGWLKYRRMRVANGPGPAKAPASRTG